MTKWKNDIYVMNTFQQVEVPVEKLVREAPRSTSARRALSEYYYLRAEYEEALRYLDPIVSVKECSVGTYLISCLVYLSLGRYGDYRALELLVAEELEGSVPKERRYELEFMKSCMEVGMYTGRSLPAWLRKGKIQLLPVSMRMVACYAYGKYLHREGRIYEMVSMIRMAFSLYHENREGISKIYLHILLAVGEQVLGHEEEMYEQLEDAIALSRGMAILAPFVEHYMYLHKPLQKLLQEEEPQLYRYLKQVGESVWTNWLAMHNQATKDHITLILTMREYQAAQLAGLGLTNREIAHRMGIAESSVKKYLNRVFDKLYIRKREELTKFIL